MSGNQGALRPTSEDELRDIVAAALADAAPLALTGGGSQAVFGPPHDAATRLDLAGLSGITLYEPEELVVSARAGTKLADIEAALAQHGQRFAFAPPDLGPLLGAPAGCATIGGVVACNRSGPARLAQGAARDHFIGVRAVSGRGEVFKSGGRVVKNVTGYDFCKLLAGSRGTLAALSEVTLRALPEPEAVRSVLVAGLDQSAAITAMTLALQSPHSVVAAAHLPGAAASRSAVEFVRSTGKAVTALLIEGFRPSVLARCEALRNLTADWGETEELHRQNSETLWREVGEVAPLLGNKADEAVWRVSAPPSAGASVVERIAEAAPVRALYDWGGGLIWITAPAGADGCAAVIRDAVGPTGGHATLYAAPLPVRQTVPIFHPQAPALAAITRRLKQAFDPSNILNPGLMAEPG